MKKDSRVYLDDILKVIYKSEQYILGKSFEEFYEDEPVRYMIVHFIQVVGEAAGHFGKPPSLIFLS
ncbi:MAG: hypothetical protein NT141_01020 [candidate division WWE3 bacterium]|nr:hypothetical protein [candidate division WWE3 bacterium]